jgi:adenosylhomocysteine nucleosidase
MQTLIIIPLQEELEPFLQTCVARGIRQEQRYIGKLAAIYLPDLQASIALGGLGKAQFALQTQHLLERSSGFDLVICAGAGGALADGLAAGDVVVGTATREHDFNNKFGTQMAPTFISAPQALAGLRRVAADCKAFNVHFGPIASGDEDIVENERRRAVREQTQALAVAWEGAGGARACAFSGVPFIEVRGITDGADHDAATDFEANLALALGHVAELMMRWLERPL